MGDNQPPDGGYDLEIFVERDKVAEYICQICHNVARNCVEVSCGNGHIFCNECIAYHFEINGASCPADRTTDISIATNDFVRRKILASNVRCRYAHYECPWAGALRQFEHHGAHCRFQPVACQYCHREVPSTKLEQHYRDCDECLVACHWCHESYRRKKLDAHRVRCEGRPVTCTNDGCQAQIAANALELHLHSECELRIVPCSLHEYGCQATVAFKDTKQHMQDSVNEHTQLQMQWLLRQNARQNAEIALLKAHIVRLEAPVYIEVSGSDVASMNGVYRKCGPVLSDHDREERKHAEEEPVPPAKRPMYVKYGDDGAPVWRLSFKRHTHEWMFEAYKSYEHAHVFIPRCVLWHDAVYPTDINTQRRWKVWMSTQNKFIEAQRLEIRAFDIVSHIQSLSNTNKSDGDGGGGQTATTGDTNCASLQNLPTPDVSGAVMNPAFVHHDEDDNEKDDVQPRMPLFQDMTTTTDWSISILIKLTYDQLYDDLLRRDAAQNHQHRRHHRMHHNPFGPPMVSNNSLHNYLSSVGYSQSLIEHLWKLVNEDAHTSSENSTNTNNLLTRNGFVAICHMLDKITNQPTLYKVPTVLPGPLQPSVLNNLISTPVHNDHLNNTEYFPAIADRDDSAAQLQQPQNDENVGVASQHTVPSNQSLLKFTSAVRSPSDGTDGKHPNLGDMFMFGAVSDPTPVQLQEEEKEDFLHLTTSTSENDEHGLLAMGMPVQQQQRSQTKPNTPNGGRQQQEEHESNETHLQASPMPPRHFSNQLNVFPAPHNLSKSRSAEMHNLQASKSSNDVFAAFGGHGGASNHNNNNSQSPRGSQRNLNQLAFAVGTQRIERNDLDDLWDTMKNKK